MILPESTCLLLGFTVACDGTKNFGLQVISSEKRRTCRDLLVADTCGLPTSYDSLQVDIKS
jgi:hypothetical protein